MKLIIEIDTGSAAFEGPDFSPELARVFEQAALAVFRYRLTKRRAHRPDVGFRLDAPLIDSNGNTCGSVREEVP